MSEQCCQWVYIKGRPWDRGHQCSATSKVVRDGKPYCKRHDPDAVKAARENRYNEFCKRLDTEHKLAQEKANARKEEKRRADCFPDLLDACELVNSLDPHKDSTTDWNHAFKVVAAAILKARGEA